MMHDFAKKDKKKRRIVLNDTAFYGPSETSVEPAGVPVQRSDRAVDTDGFYCGAVSVCKADAGSGKRHPAANKKDPRGRSPRHPGVL